MTNFILKPEHLSNIILGDFNDIFRRRINELLLDSGTGLTDVIDSEKEVNTKGLDINNVKKTIYSIIVSGKDIDYVLITGDLSSQVDFDAVYYCLKVQKAIASLLKSK